MRPEDYQAGVQYLAERAPNHPLLKSLLREHKRINEMYLTRILKEIGPPAKPKVERVTVDQGKSKHDPLLDPIYDRMRKKYGYRAKLSNQFHDCKTDEQRAELSDDIRQVQNAIEELQKTVRYYKRHGVMPAEGEAKAEEIVESGVELMKRRNSLDNSIFYYRKKVREARDDDKKNIPQWELKIKQLQNEREGVNRKIGQEAL